MKIIVDVSAYFEWEPCEAPEFIKEQREYVHPNKFVEMVDVVVGIKLRGEPILESDIKLNHAGVWLEKVLVDKETHTEVNIPESQIEDCMQHYERIGAKKSRKQTVAWYLGEKVMPHHAHPDHFTNITVEGEPEVETFLKMFFEVGAQAS